MGFDCGFDIFPCLEANPANKQAYQQFLDEIVLKYADVRDQEGQEKDGKVLKRPADPNSFDKVNIYFMVGECPKMPSNPDRCNHFLRFSSKVSSNLTASAEAYIRDVCEIAKKYFGSRIHFWHEMNETEDERQWGCYNWQQIHDAEKKLREVETHDENKSAPQVAS